MTPEHIRLLEQCVIELRAYESLKEWAKDYTPKTRAEYARIHALIDRCRTFINAYYKEIDDEEAAQGHA